MEAVKQFFRQATLNEARATARLDVLEAVLADLYRLYLAASSDEADLSEVREGLGRLSKKLLDKQAADLDIQGTARQQLIDIRAGLAEQPEPAKDPAEAAAE